MTILSPLPVQKFFDNNGNPLANGQLFTYSAGTSTPVGTYTDSTGLNLNTNPVILNSRGECNLWLSANVAYKLQLEDSFGNTIWTVDQIVNSQLITLYGGVDTGVGNAYILNFPAPYSSLQNGIVIYWVPSNTNTAISVITVNSLGSIPIVNIDGTGLTPQQIVAGQPVQMMYYNGNWILLNNSYVGGSFTVVGAATIGGASSTGLNVWGTIFAGQISIRPDQQTVTATPSAGFTGSPTWNITFFRIGPLVTCIIDPATGTSGGANSTQFSLNTPGANPAFFPSGVAHVQNIACPSASLVDNSATVNAPVEVQVGSGGGLTFYKTYSATGWAGSGTKGFQTRTVLYWFATSG